MKRLSKAVILVLSIFFILISGTFFQEARADNNDNEFKEALSVTGKAVRKIQEVKDLERKLIRIGKGYIKDLPYSEELIAGLALITQPLKFKINRYQKIELDIRNSQVSYQFLYTF